MFSEGPADKQWHCPTWMPTSMKWTVLDMRVSNLEKNVTMLEATMTYWSMTGEVLYCVS